MVFFFFSRRLKWCFVSNFFFVDKQPIIFKADFSIDVWRKRKSILVLHLVSNHLKWMLRLENKKKYHYNFGFSFWKWDFFFVNWRRRIFTIGNFPTWKILIRPLFLKIRILSALFLLMNTYHTFLEHLLEFVNENSTLLEKSAGNHPDIEMVQRNICSAYFFMSKQAMTFGVYWSAL